MKDKLKIFTCGVLSGAIVLTAGGYYLGYSVKKENDQSMKEFTLPQLEESVKTTKEEEEYTFNYYGTDITIQSDKVTVYSFNEDGSLNVEDGQKVEVPVDNYDYLLTGYVSQTESAVFYRLKNKDNKEIIKSQYDVYLIFYWMRQAFQEYFNRENFDTMQNRKDAIYTACYDYINDEIKIGGYKFSDLNIVTKENISSIYKEIAYMYKNNETVSKNSFDKFIDSQENVLQYTLSIIGRK